MCLFAVYIVCNVLSFVIYNDVYLSAENTHVNHVFFILFENIQKMVAIKENLFGSLDIMFNSAPAVLNKL